MALKDKLTKRLGPLAAFAAGTAGAFSQKIPEKLPKTLRETLYLRGFAFLRIPLLYFISPTVVELSEDVCVVKVPLNRRTKNHLGSMYFGVLCAGADCAGGLMAMQLVRERGMTMVFKDFQANFLKRPEGDVHFRCAEGETVRQLVARAEASGERENASVRVTATVPSKMGDEPVAEFVLTLSIKKKG